MASAPTRPAGPPLARTQIIGNSSAGTSAINFSAAPSVAIVELSQDIINAANKTTNNIPLAQLALHIPDVILEEQQAQHTDGGTFSSGLWATRCS